MNDCPAGKPAETDSPESRTGEISVREDGWPLSRAGFERLAESVRDRLVRYAFRRTGRLEDAEDIVQGVLLKAYRDSDKLRTVRLALPYLFRMTANACTDFERFRRRQTARLEELPVESLADRRPGAGIEAEALLELRRIEKILRCLPPQQAEVVRLRVLEELSFAEIAAVLGCPAATVKSRFRYGLDKLRDQLARDREVER